jgi:murein DD-endopeptidase MepM/ murein hydrolase activator NlpD
MATFSIKGPSRQVWTLDLRTPRRLGLASALASVVLLSVFILGAIAGACFVDSQSGHSESRLVAEMQTQRQALERERLEVQNTFDALSVKVGELNARVIRLDVVGKQLAQAAGLHGNEFQADGSATSAPDSRSSPPPVVTDTLNRLSSLIERNEHQMAALEGFFLDERLRDGIVPDGPPVRSPRVTSLFGSREDPFTGFSAFHPGIDFAGELGSPVSAVAAGVVVFAGDRSGYGNLIEIDHGMGLVTRYGHNSRLLVSPGDIVQRGQVVALMGSTGHSTGPHVHFEVLKDGQTLNPLAFVGNSRASVAMAQR